MVIDSDDDASLTCDDIAGGPADTARRRRDQRDFVFVSHRLFPSVESRGFRHDLDSLWLAGAYSHAAGPAVFPGAKTILDPSRRAYQRLQIHPFVRDRGSRLFL